MNIILTILVIDKNRIFYVKYNTEWKLYLEKIRKYDSCHINTLSYTISELIVKIIISITPLSGIKGEHVLC